MSKGPRFLFEHALPRGNSAWEFDVRIEEQVDTYFDTIFRTFEKITFCSKIRDSFISCTVALDVERRV